MSGIAWSAFLFLIVLWCAAALVEEIAVEIRRQRDDARWWKWYNEKQKEEEL